MQRFKSPGSANASCPFTPPSKTLSTSSAISHPAARSASSERKLSGRGELRQPHELELGPDFPRPIQVHVTESTRELRDIHRLQTADVTDTQHLAKNSLPQNFQADFST
jgi:hypothetical protein